MVEHRHLRDAVVAGRGLAAVGDGRRLIGWRPGRMFWCTAAPPASIGQWRRQPSAPMIELAGAQGQKTEDMSR